MTEQQLIQQHLLDFQINPGLMSIDSIKDVLKFYQDYQSFVEAELVAFFGELNDLNKIGKWNENTVKIEKAKWYISYLTEKNS